MAEPEHARADAAHRDAGDGAVGEAALERLRTCVARYDGLVGAEARRLERRSPRAADLIEPKIGDRDHARLLEGRTRIEDLHVPQVRGVRKERGVRRNAHRNLALELL